MSRPYRDVIDRRKFPKAIGWHSNLYTLPGAPLGQRNLIEDHFFALTDQAASNAVAAMILQPDQSLSNEMRSSFTRLLTSFMHRTPDRVEALRLGLSSALEPVMEGVRKRHAEGEELELPDGMSLDEALQAWREQIRTFEWGKVLTTAINSPFIGNHLINMHWFVRNLIRACDTFMTADKPLVHSNGIGKEDGNIALALSPTTLFVATNNKRTADNILNVSDDFFVTRFNHEVAKNARNYVYAEGRSQLSFVERRLGVVAPPPPRFTGRVASQYWLIR